MLSSLRKLHNKIGVTPETNDSYQAHLDVLLSSKVQVYSGQRTHFSLLHKMFMGLGINGKSTLDYNYGKFKINTDGSIKPAADNIKSGLHFFQDGGIMNGKFYKWGGLKNGVFFRAELGVVEEGLFANQKLVQGLRLCENGNFEEGLFENGHLIQGLRHGRFDRIVEEGSFKEGVLVKGMRYAKTGEPVSVEESVKADSESFADKLQQALELDDDLMNRALTYSDGEDDDNDDNYLSD